MLVVLLAIIDSKNKLRRCWAELCRPVSVAGQGWATEKSVRPLFRFSCLYPFIDNRQQNQCEDCRRN